MTQIRTTSHPDIWVIPVAAGPSTPTGTPATDNEDHYSDRDKTICMRANRAVLTDPRRAEEILWDARVHSELDRLKSVLCTADKAMRAEGIEEDGRDRILHWLLFGTPPKHTDPVEAIDAAVRQRLDEETTLRVTDDRPPTIPQELL